MDNQQPTYPSLAHILAGIEENTELNIKEILNNAQRRISEQSKAHKSALQPSFGSVKEQQ
jgi:hypothetical protein